MHAVGRYLTSWRFSIDNQWDSVGTHSHIRAPSCSEESWAIPLGFSAELCRAACMAGLQQAYLRSLHGLHGSLDMSRRISVQIFAQAPLLRNSSPGTPKTGI